MSQYWCHSWSLELQSLNPACVPTSVLKWRISLTSSQRRQQREAAGRGEAIRAKQISLAPQVLKLHHWGVKPSPHRVKPLRCTGWASTIVLVPLCNKTQQFATFELQLVGNWPGNIWITNIELCFLHWCALQKHFVFLFFLSSTLFPDCTYKT